MSYANFLPKKDTKLKFSSIRIERRQLLDRAFGFVLEANAKLGCMHIFSGLSFANRSAHNSTSQQSPKKFLKISFLRAQSRPMSDERLNALLWRSN